MGQRDKGRSVDTEICRQITWRNQFRAGGEPRSHVRLNDYASGGTDAALRAVSCRSNDGNRDSRTEIAELAYAARRSDYDGTELKRRCARAKDKTDQSDAGSDVRIGDGLLAQKRSGGAKTTQESNVLQLRKGRSFGKGLRRSTTLTRTVSINANTLLAKEMQQLIRNAAAS